MKGKKRRKEGRKRKIINRETCIDFFSDRNPRLYAIDFVQIYCEKVLVTAVYLSPELLLCAYTSSHNSLTLVIHTDIPLCFSCVGSVLSLSCRVVFYLSLQLLRLIYVSCTILIPDMHQLQCYRVHTPFTNGAS